MNKLLSHLVHNITGRRMLLLRGETLHKGCGINVDLSTTKVWLHSDQEMQMWKDCCLLIIDEISFATRGILQTWINPCALDETNRI